MPDGQGFAAAAGAKQPAKNPADTPSAIRNAFSVDVEDYFQVYAFDGLIGRERWPEMDWRVEDNTIRFLDLLSETKSYATFFTLGMIAERFPSLMRRIVEAGHELASHGWAHFHVFEQDRAAFLDDITRTKKVLQDTSGQDVTGYRAASFSINPKTWWAYGPLAEAGYRYSSSVNPIAHDHYGVPNAPRTPFRPGEVPIAELPISTVERFGRRLPAGGGGYFRLFPYAVFEANLNRLNRREGMPGIFYTHPWEIDPQQPRIAGASTKARFRHYVNLDKMQGKLRRLLSRFPFDRIDRVFPTDPADLPVWSPPGAV